MFFFWCWFRFLRKIVLDEKSDTSEDRDNKQNVSSSHLSHSQLQHNHGSHSKQRDTAPSATGSKISDNTDSRGLSQNSIQLSTLIAPDPPVPINFVRFSDSGNRLLYCNQNGKIQIYNFNKTQKSSSKSSQSKNSNHTRYIPQLIDTLRIEKGVSVVDILIGTSMNEIKVWNVNYKQYQKGLVSFAKYNCRKICCLAVSPAQSEHNFVVCCKNEYMGNNNDNSATNKRLESMLYLYSVNMNKYSLILKSNALTKYEITTMIFNHNGNILITGCNDGVIRIFDVNQGFPVLMHWEAHDKAIISLHLCSDANSVLSFAKDYCVRHWALLPPNVCQKNWVLNQELMEDGPLSNDGKKNNNSNKPIKSSRQNENVLCLALGPDNYFAVSNGRDSHGKYTVMLQHVCAMYNSVGTLCVVCLVLRWIKSFFVFFFLLCVFCVTD